MARHKLGHLLILVALICALYPARPKSAEAVAVFSNFPLIGASPVNINFSSGSVHKAVIFSAQSQEVWQINSISVIMSQATDTPTAPATVHMEVRTSDIDSTRGTLLGDLGTVSVTGGTTKSIYTFTPSTTILLGPDEYYWVELYATGNFLSTDFAQWWADSPSINPSTANFQLEEYLFTATNWTSSNSSNMYNLIQMDASTIGTATPTITPTSTDIPTATTTPPTATALPPTATCAVVVTSPGLISPVHRAHTTDTTPTFSWNSVTGAESYRLMVYLEDRSFEYKKRTFNTSYTLQVGEALTVAKYLWRVRTQDLACSTWTGWSTRNTLFVD